MYQLQEDRFYYLTLYNENYPMPAMPQDLNPEGVLKGIYRFQARRRAKLWCTIRQRSDFE